MNILFITQLFQPEPNHLKGLSFAQELVRRGHNVNVLTGFPNYPGGKIYPGYKQTFYMKEVLGGVPVTRVPLFPDHSNSGLRRILCYVSFALSACVPGLFLLKKPDVVHVYQGPATLAFPAMVLKILFGIPYVLDVQDLWPESVLGSGMLKSRIFSFLLHLWCDLTYRLADKIVVLSEGYKKSIIGRGVPEDKIEVVYNWCVDPQFPGSQPLDDLDPYNLKGRFNVVYAGNLGRVQALDVVIKAADLLKDELPELRMVFVGDGVDADRLKYIVTEDKVSNVRFIPRQPVDRMGEIFRKADALLIHLRDDPLSRIGIPQKTQAYLAAARPIIMALSGDAANLVKSADAGIVCEQENANSIASAIRSIAEMSPEEREILAANGRRFYDEKLSFSVGSSKMEKIFSSVGYA